MNIGHFDAYRFIWQDRIFSVGISIGIAAIDGSTLSSNVALAYADNAWPHLRGPMNLLRQEAPSMKLTWASQWLTTEAKPISEADQSLTETE